MYLTKTYNNFYYFKKIKFLKETKIQLEYIIIQKFSYIFVNSFLNIHNFFKINSQIKIIKKNDNTFFYCKNLLSLNIISNKFQIFLKKIFEKNKIKQKLLLRGLGYKAFFKFEDNSILSFKIGFSHLVNIHINPAKVFITIKKNSISFEGFDSNYIGNLCKTIKHFKKKDVYKQKGFLYRYEPIFFKPVKKK